MEYPIGRPAERTGVEMSESPSRPWRSVGVGVRDMKKLPCSDKPTYMHRLTTSTLRIEKSFATGGVHG